MKKPLKKILRIENDLLLLNFILVRRKTFCFKILKLLKSICDELAIIQKPISDNDKVIAFAIDLGSKCINFVDSQLFKPPYPTFSQFVSDLNNHEVCISSYDEQKLVNHNLTFVGTKDSGKAKGRGRGRGGIG